MKRYPAGLVLASTLVFGACGGQAELAPDSQLATTPTVIDRTMEPYKPAQIASLFRSNALAEFKPDFITRFEVSGETLDFESIDALNDYGDFIKKSIPFIVSIVGDMPLSTINFVTADTRKSFTYIPELRPSKLRTLVLVPDNFETGLNVEGQTVSAELTNQKGEYVYTKSVTVVKDTEDMPVDPLTDAMNSTSFVIFTELIQNLVIAKPSDIQKDDPNYLPIQIEGQERLANGVGRAYVSSRLGHSYDQYVSTFANSFTTITGQKMPILIVSPLLYAKIINFASTIPGDIK